MAGGQSCPVDLFPGEGAPPGVAVVNERCLVRTQDGHRIVIVSGVPLAQYAVGDAMAEASAMVNLAERGWAEQKQIARAFGCSARTVRRHQRRFEEGGLAALGRAGEYPRGRPRILSSRSRTVGRLKAEGLSNREIARRVGVDEKAVRKLLRRLGWAGAPRPVQVALTGLELEASSADPNLSPPGEPSPAEARSGTAAGADPNLSASSLPAEDDLPVSFDADPANRSVDRLLACLGLLDDAAPLFRSGVRAPLVATWQLSVRPSVPEYWRATPIEWVPFFGKPVSSRTRASIPGSS
jgi:DNA-binding CsgD family transcriptional regulator